MQGHIWWTILLVSSSLHFSLCLYTHLAFPLHLLRCDIPALRLHLLLLLPFHPSVRRSISPSCPLSHTSLPITPSVYLSPRPHLFILPVYSNGDHAVAKATGAIVYPVARWLVAVAMIKNSEAPPPPLPLLLLLPSIDKSSQFFSSFCCPSLPPSLLLTTLLEEKHADL